MEPTTQGITSRSSTPQVYTSIAIALCLILFADDTKARKPFKYYDDIKEFNILQWTPGNQSPLDLMGKGNSKLIECNCTYQNCYVTDNRTYLPDITHFDAIVFNGVNLIKMTDAEAPQRRSPKQRFVFVGVESAHMKLSCNPKLENFFNWTWTYKIDSDIRWPYILINNLKGKEVGPKINMKWPHKLKRLKDEETKAILNGKSKAAAWFVSRCTSLGGREKYVRKLLPRLSKLNLTLDVYGRCGNLTCRKKHAEKCFDMVKKDYYFYLAFENSLAPDYVTEKLFTALDNYAIPIVYGGADYTRFLPPGSYLKAGFNTGDLNPKSLARIMKEIINNKTRYYDFFRWRNHFIYKHVVRTTAICNLCTALNEDLDTNLNLVDSFRDWWIDGVANRICDK